MVHCVDNRDGEEKKLSRMDIYIHDANTSLTYNLNDMSKQIITFF